MQCVIAVCFLIILTYFFLSHVVLEVLRLQKSIEFPSPTHLLFGRICKLKRMLAGAETCLKLNITTFFSPSRFGVRIG